MTVHDRTRLTGLLGLFPPSQPIRPAAGPVRPDLNRLVARVLLL